MYLDEYLNGVNYQEFADGYIPSPFALEFMNFIKLVNLPGKESNKTPLFHLKMLDNICSLGHKRLLNICFRGSGKALALDTPVMTPTGYVNMGDLTVGDWVIDRNGQPARVTYVSPEFHNPTYKITLSNGSWFIANEDHLHFVQSRTITTDPVTKKKYNTWKEHILSTKEIVERGVIYKRPKTERNPRGYEYKWAIPLVRKPVEFEDKGKFPIDPYTVGLLLGDGHYQRHGQNISLTSSLDDVNELCSYIPYEHNSLIIDKRQTNTCNVAFKQLGILWGTVIGDAKRENKAIPKGLVFGSVNDRIEVVRGLMDSDGTITPKGYYSFTNISPYLAYGLHYIVMSLGGYSKVRHYDNAYAGYYTVTFNLLDINPFKLKRKAQYWQPDRKFLTGPRIPVDSIELTPEPVPTKCISVDSDTESYLICDSIPTHNTSLCVEYLILYLAVFGKLPGLGTVTAMIFIGDSMENGVKAARNNIEFRYNSSEFLKQNIKSARFTENYLEFYNLEGKPFGVKLFGAATGMRGTKIFGKRPTLAVIDDLISDAAEFSPVTLRNIKNTIYNGLMNAVDPTNYKIIFNGTPFNKKDPLVEAVESGSWTVNAYPVCERFPCTKEEFKGAWEDRFSYEFVKEAYENSLKDGIFAAFNRELMLRVTADEDRLILDSDIKWYSKHNLLSANSYNLNYFITTDFATSSHNSADYSVLFVWGLDSDKDYYLIDAIVKRQTMDVNFEDLFSLVQRYKPMSVGIEITGQQGSYISFLKQQMEQRNIWFTLASNAGSKSFSEGIRPIVDKFTRFNSVLPLFKSGHVYFPQEMRDTFQLREIVSELSLITVDGIKSKHDDCIDGISMLGMMRLWRPAAPLRAEPVPVMEHNSVFSFDYKAFEPIPESAEVLKSYIV